MLNIIQQLTDFHESTGEYPTHIMLSNEQYDKIMLDNGVKTHGLKPFTELYGMKLIFTEVPIDEPKVLKIIIK